MRVVGPVIFGLILGYVLGDLFAFYVWHDVFDYGFYASVQLNRICIGYVAIAFVVSTNKESAKQLYPWLWLAQAHALTGKWMWRLFWFAMLSGVLLSIVGSVTSKRSTHYVEVIGDWYAQGFKYNDYGSDSYTSPQASRSPMFRDVVSGEVFQASDNRDDNENYALLKNRGLKIEPDFTKTRVKYRAFQAKIVLDVTIFGKNRIIDVAYEELETLPPSVQKHAFSRIVAQPDYAFRLRDLVMGHPELWPK